MLSRRSFAACAPFLFWALFCVYPGCNRSDRPAAFPVQGKVTYQGKPVAGATVAFLAPGAPRPAVGRTDESGNYSLTTFETDDGAVAGTHVVTVRKVDLPPSASASTPQPSPEGEIDPAAVEKDMQQTALRMRKARSALPTKYADRKTTTLRLEVAPRENTLEIKLVD